MSKLVTLSDNSSELYLTLQEPIHLENEWEIGMVNFTCYNSIANINEGINNKIMYGDLEIALRTGAYEIESIIKEIKKHLPSDHGLKIIANNNTMQCEIYSDKPLDLSAEDSLADVLGFERTCLAPDKWHYSTQIVKIRRISAIRIMCNLASGSISHNGDESHVIYDFVPSVPPGYLMIRRQSPVIYLAMSTNVITSIYVKIVDQNGRLVDFRGDRVSVCLHLRQKKKRNGSCSV